MSDYTKTTDFTAKDALASGNPNKVIKGSEHDTEFDAIAVSNATKANKIVGGTNNAVVLQSATGDLVDGSQTLPAGSLVGTTATQTLTNKSIDSDNNTITNITNADIKSGANINANKIGTGVVSNTEFNYVNGVTSSIQTQLTGKMTGSNNLSETTNAGTCRTNIGLGGLAVLDSVAAGQIDANSVGSSELKTAVSVSGFFSVPASSSYTFAAGFYNIIIDDATLIFSMYVNGAWRNAVDLTAGLIWADGTNMRVTNLDASVGTFWYQTLS